MRYSKDELRKSMRLYAVTDSSWLAGRTLEEVVEEALAGGITFLQIREKDLPYEQFKEKARSLKAAAQKYHVPYVVNDNVELAKEIDADGVHIGQGDMSIEEVKKILGEDKIIGVSAQTVEQALLAESQGASYLGVGAVFATGTKPDASHVGIEGLRKICEAVSIPVVAIGGIHASNIPEMKGCGADGIAVVSAIFASDNIEKACRKLRALSGEMLV